MSILLKWLSRALIGFFLLSAIAAIVSYNLASRSLPVYDQNLVSDHIINQVEIIRDSSNIPHIFASKDEDAFFALGLGASSSTDSSTTSSSAILFSFKEL